MWPITKIKQDNDVIDHKVVILIEYVLNCQDWLDNVPSMMKMRQDNNVTDCDGPVYIENETELS